MPGMSGKGLVDLLSSKRPTMKVIYMSGYTDEAILHHGVLDPGTAFLQKPFTLNVLVHKVHEVLRRQPEKNSQ
jgi:FixJ family two-component response regulator